MVNSFGSTLVSCNGNSPLRGKVPAGYRVMARTKDRADALVSLARTRAEAVARAKAFCEGLGRLTQTGRNKIRVVQVEEWVGTVMAGTWKRMPEHRGGFVRVFHSEPRHVAARRTQSGQCAACVLLSERTRKKGWQARLCGAELAGPITNTADVPSSVHSGQKVTLRIGALSADGKRVQFQWLADSAKVDR